MVLILVFLIRWIYPQIRRSYYLFFNYLSYYLYVLPVWYKNRGGGCYPFGTKLPFLGLPVWYWKTPLNHRYLWINLTVVVVQNAVRSPRTGFRWRGDPWR